MSVDREAAGAAPKSERELGSKKTGWGARIGLVVASVGVSLALLEVGYRVVIWGPQGLVNWPNLVHQRMGIGPGGDSCQYVYSPAIGWKSPANCASASFNSDGDGFRRSASQASLAEPPILVTGSSFAKGDEVGDNEAWPAYLQDMIGRKVVNAGVSGYAFDQTVLSTEQLVPKVKPLLVIASFTPGDIRRAEMKIAWSRDKPFFTVKEGKLDLHNVPVPGKPGEPVRFPLAAEWLGRFALAELVAGRLGLQRGWYFREVRGAPAGTGETVACLLMRKLAALSVPVVVMAQYSRNYWDDNGLYGTAHHRAVRKVLECAAAAGLIPFDTADTLKPAVDARGAGALYRTDHHSAEGNRVVADLVVRELVNRRLLDRTADR
jgi:hypothetical protein